MANSELVALKGSHMSAPTPLQLGAVRQKIVDLKTRLDAIQIQDLEFAVSELRFAAYAKKVVDELQRVRVSLLKKNEQLKGENDGLEASIVGGEAPDDAAAKSVTAAEGVATE
ncbi:hypothetical protein ACFX14_042952 [Malus domestica]